VKIQIFLGKSKKTKQKKHRNKKPFSVFLLKKKKQSVMQLIVMVQRKHMYLK